jgi:tetratricopeptide (TPR) repeat protein
VSTLLADWSTAIEWYLQNDDPDKAVAAAQVILKRLPRHLPTYQRLLRAAWVLKRWDEGEDWGRRLLRADPGNALAWRALAMAAEQHSQRTPAHAMWQRAFEADPYEPEIRAGLSRTALHSADPARASEPDVLGLNLACLARLWLRAHRWERAEALYRQLLQADPRRIDFQLGLLAALWQQQQRAAVYPLARSLVQSQPHLLLAWVAAATFGDVNDQALARNPIETMDPDGEFVSLWFGLPQERRRVELVVSTGEAEWFNSDRMTR